MRDGAALRASPRLLAVILGCAATTPAIANDSTAELGAGGVQLIQNDVIGLLSEDLFVSANEVRVAYRFLNRSESPATFLVAFPLPAIDAIVPQEMNIVLPNAASENFVDFTVTVDGQSVTPQISARASVLGVDRTAELTARGLPLNPASDTLYEKLQSMTPDEIAELNRLGLVVADPYGAMADWRLDQAFYWEQTFPPGKEVAVQHSYRPVVGYAFFGKENLNDDYYKTKFCVDPDFAIAATKKLDTIKGSQNPYMDEQRISYVLTTANNWAAPIKSFRLVVDKGDPDALVSFCAKGVRKIGPTTFEVTATDYTAERELDVLIVRPHKEN